MSHPLSMHHTLDSVVLLTLATGAETTLLTGTDHEMRMLMLPMLGALIASGGMILLNPCPETRRIVIGRSVFALLFGTCMPQIIGMFHPSLAEISLRPVVLLLIGAICAGVAYVLSRPFTEGMYKRAESVAERELNRLEALRFQRESSQQDLTAATKEQTAALREQTQKPAEVTIVNTDAQPVPVEPVHKP